MAANKEHGHDAKPPVKPDPAITHETAEVDVKSIATFGVVLVVISILSLALVVGLFRYFAAREDAGQVKARPGVSGEARRMPPLPRLQTTPVTDLRAVRAAEEKMLNSYGWVDQQKGLAHVPIARAIELLAARGLPARQENTFRSESAGVSVPTESSLNAEAGK